LDPLKIMYITEKAVKQVKEIADAEGIGYYIVRAKVLGGGCHGMTHDLTFDDQISDTDEVIELDGVKVIIDMMSFQYLENACIDYVESAFGGGFKFSSPDIKSSCGCGSSVTY
jgi:iron-sulfur cluster insertion protein